MSADLRQIVKVDANVTEVLGRRTETEGDESSAGRLIFRVNERMDDRRESCIRFLGKSVPKTVKQQRDAASPKAHAAEVRKDIEIDRQERGIAYRLFACADVCERVVGTTFGTDAEGTEPRVKCRDSLTKTVQFADVIRCV